MKLLEAVGAWLERHAESLRSLPIIRELWERLEPQATAKPQRPESLDYFLNGHSIARSAALVWPGHHGAIIVAEQRQLEEAARALILDLEERLHAFQQVAAQASGAAAVKAQRLDKDIARLQKENARLRQELTALHVQRAQAAQSAPAAQPATR